MLPNIAGLQSVFNVGTAVPVSVTGDTVERELARFIIPAGHVLGSAGFVRLTALMAETNNANVKTCRLRYGSTVGPLLGSTALTGNQGGQNLGWFALIREPKLRCVQVLNGYGWTGAAFVDQTVDLEVDIPLVLTAQLANAGDTVTLEAAMFEGYKF